MGEVIAEGIYFVLGFLVSHIVNRISERRSDQKQNIAAIRISVKGITERYIEFYTSCRTKQELVAANTNLSLHLKRLGSEIHIALINGHLSDSDVRVAFRQFHDATTKGNFELSDIPLSQTDLRVRRIQRAEMTLLSIIK